MSWKGKREVKSYIIYGIVFLVVFVLNSTAITDVVTSDLTITPTPCKRGDVLHFSVSVYNSPTSGMTPGTTYYALVVFDNTHYPELNPWSTEVKPFKLSCSWKDSYHKL